MIECFKSKSDFNGTFNYTIKEKYDKFYKMHEQLVFSASDFTKVSNLKAASLASYFIIYFLKKTPISLDPLFDTYSPNSSLCNECKENYINLTDHYKSLGTEKKLCMDVVDLVSIDIGFKIGKTRTASFILCLSSIIPV